MTTPNFWTVAYANAIIPVIASWNYTYIYMNSLHNLCIKRQQTYKYCEILV